MSWSTIIIQLGISALVLYVGYQIALKVIASSAAAEAARTLALKEGMAEQAKSLRDGLAAVSSDIRDLTKQVIGMDSKLDILCDLTPVREMKAIHEQHSKPREAKVIVQSDLHGDNDPPIDPPPPGKKPERTGQTPPFGAPYGPITRKKTVGGDK